MRKWTTAGFLLGAAVLMALPATASAAPDNKDTGQNGKCVQEVALTGFMGRSLNPSRYAFIGGTEGPDGSIGGPIPSISVNEGEVYCAFGGGDALTLNFGWYFAGPGDNSFAQNNGTYVGGPGRDLSYVNAENYGTFYGNGGDDHVFGNTGEFFGGDGDDRVGYNVGYSQGDAGNDSVYLLFGTFYGGSGDDTVDVNFGGHFDGGPGYDVIGENMPGATCQNVEVVLAGPPC